MKLLTIGEVMAEIRVGESGEFAVGFAGDTYNTAVYCARALASPKDVKFMTRVGTDPLSLELMKSMASEGLATDTVTIDRDRNLGIYSVSTDSSGERSFHYWRSQSAARRLFCDDEDLQHLADYDIVYVSGITVAIISPDARQRLIDALSALSKQGVLRVAFDSNYRPKLWESGETARAVISAFWDLADICLPSIDDEMALFDETAEQVLARFSSKRPGACAIKRGDLGPFSPKLHENGQPDFPPAQKVVDTTAAGDSFNAGYLAALMEGKTEAECLRTGHDLACRVVQVPGAIAPRDSG